MSVIGFMISEILDKSLLHNGNGMQETYSFSDEELMMLLPTVFIYLNSVISKFSKQSKPFQVIISAYGRVLFGGFSEWKIFVSSIIFEIGLDKPLTASTEEYLNLFSESVLGKAILMVQDHLTLSEDIMKLDRRLGLFNYVCPSSADNIFDYFRGETGLHSLERPLEFVNRVVAKINFCRVLLFSDYDHSHPQLDNGDKEMILPQVTSDIEKLRTRLLRMLINSWKLIVKKFQYNNDYSGEIDCQNVSLFRFLEVYVMNNILELTTEMHDCLTKLDHLPFIEQLVKSYLRYRFGDHATLKMLRNVLTSLSHGKFSCASVIQLLLAHSQFAQSIHLRCQSLVSTQFGLVFAPMQSILRSFVVPRNAPDALDCKNNKLTSQERLILLELAKFVRVLFQIYAQQRELNFGEDIDINFKELIYLLLFSYGATCTEVDMEICDLMLDIESTDKSSAGTVAQMDYLWGIASLKVKKELEQDKDVQSVDPRTMELFEERKRIKFRENISIDPKLCTQTVLYFPYNRFVNGGTSHRLEKASSTVMHKASSATENTQIYDPVFILRFSIHCLSVSYIEPVEFASLGLLAVTFASLSSPDCDMRKLGYEALAKFKCALEAIPLFQNLFWSSSTSFREDRLWMLRLLYVGLNTEDDAQIYISNSIFEILMSFYSSPLSDNDSRELIIQVCLVMLTSKPVFSLHMNALYF